MVRSDNSLATIVDGFNDDSDAMATKQIWAQETKCSIKSISYNTTYQNNQNRHRSILMDIDT